jgi:glycosyltransferase involved in cell wall biosynthesis
MKILHASTATSWRGGEQQIAYLLAELSRLQAEQVVCCPVGSPLNERLSSFRVDAAPFTSRGILDLKLAKHLATVCHQRKVSIIHAHDSHAHSAAVLAAALFGLHVPVILSRRVDFPVSRNAFSRWKYNHPSIRKILCVSKKIEAVMRNDIKDTSKLTVIYDGIDISRFATVDRATVLAEFGWPASAVVIGNASALADHKDYFTFVDTAVRVLQKVPGAKFLVAGDGPERENIQQYIASKGMTEHICLAGFRSDVPRLLTCMNVFLMTSMTEGLGSIVLDAFAAGVPVVATRAGGIPEIVHDNETGLLAPVKDSAKLAEHVLRILSDPALAARLREQAQVFVRNFSKDKMAEATLQTYQEVIKI